MPFLSLGCLRHYINHIILIITTIIFIGPISRAQELINSKIVITMDASQGPAQEDSVITGPAITSGRLEYKIILLKVSLIHRAHSEGTNPKSLDYRC